MKAFKTSNPSVIKLTGAGGPGVSGTEEAKSAVPGPPLATASSTTSSTGVQTSVAPAPTSISRALPERTITSDVTASFESPISTIVNPNIDYIPPKTDFATMSFVLQLSTTEERETNASTPETSLSTTTLTSVSTKQNPRPPQNPKNVAAVAAPSGVTCGISKSVPATTVVYPVNRIPREGSRISVLPTTATQVPTTRVISQKLPSTTCQHQANITAVSSPSNITQTMMKPATITPVNNVIPLLQQTQAEILLSQNSSLIAKVTHDQSNQQSQQSMATLTAVPAGVHHKLQPVQTTMKPLTAIGPLPNIHRVQVKSQAVPVTGMPNAPTVNYQKVKTVSNSQRPPVTRVPITKSQQPMTTLAQVPAQQVTMCQVMSNASMQRVQQPQNVTKVQPTQVFPCQKNQAQPNNPTVLTNHKSLQAQQPQMPPQVMQHKLSVMPQKTMAVQRQQAPQNVNSVAKNNAHQQIGLQKVINAGQIAGTSQPRPVSMGILQRTQTMPSLRSSPVMTTLQQKVPGQTPSGNPRNQTATKVQQTQQQQQMASRTGPANMHPGTKNVQYRSGNPGKNIAQGVIQQQQNRNANLVQPVRILQQQQSQHIHGQVLQLPPQQTSQPISTLPQKQPGGIKTIPAQKPSVQRNNTQKVTGIKTSLNTNMSALKGHTGGTGGVQKSSVRTLLPQQAGGIGNMIVQKNHAGKSQQQCGQGKMVMTAQYPQQRTQPGQIKTILPVVDPRREMDVK